MRRFACGAVVTVPRLYTIPISHYGERARWALDLAGVDYEERHHLQMFSWAVALRTGGKKTLPVLVTTDGVVNDSADIVHWASAHGADLSADQPEVVALSRRFADELGVDSRRFAYDCMFRVGDRALAYNAGRSPRAEVAVMRAGLPVARRFMRSYLGVHAPDVVRALATVDRVFDEIAGRLAGERTFLVGNRFTAADLTFAAMAAPCLLPVRYGVTLPTLDELHPTDRARVAAWRAHPAGRYALRLYDARPVPRGRVVRTLRIPPRAHGFPA